MKKQSYDIDPAAVAPQAPPTEEELAAAKETVKQERKQSRLAKASFAWTVISMLYAIVSGAVLISGKWILAPYSYIMAGLLGVYVVIFVVLVVSFAGDAKAGKKKIKTFNNKEELYAWADSYKGKRVYLLDWSDPMNKEAKGDGSTIRLLEVRVSRPIGY